MYNMYTHSHELHEFKILSNVEIFILWSFLQFVYENLTKILLKMKIPKHFLFYSMILSSHILCTNTAIHCLSFLYLSSISKLSSQIIHFLNKILKKKRLMIIPHKQRDMSWTVLSEVQSIGASWANQETKIFILHDALQNTRSTFWIINDQVQQNTFKAKCKGQTT